MTRWSRVLCYLMLLMSSMSRLGPAVWADGSHSFLPGRLFRVGCNRDPPYFGALARLSPAEDYVDFVEMMKAREDLHLALNFTKPHGDPRGF